MILSTLSGPNIHIKTLKWDLLKSPILAEALRRTLRRKPTGSDFHAAGLSLLQSPRPSPATPRSVSHQEEDIVSSLARLNLGPYTCSASSQPLSHTPSPLVLLPIFQNQKTSVIPATSEIFCQSGKNKSLSSNTNF